ncbi:MAG: MFS transporter [Actinomycetia bacterium]|nr:MFS transporter [Actinomycetes bacterium]
MVLYSIQALLPTLARVFATSPAGASLVLSSTTAALALSLPAVGLLSDRIGRRPVMLVSLGATSTLGLASAFAPTLPMLLAVRTLIGFALGGITAVAMAHLSEEVEPRSLGSAMGIYISGNTIGGLSGRLLVSVLEPWAGWHGALAAVGVVALAATAVFWRLLPPTRHFVPAARPLRALLRAIREQFADPVLARLFGLGAVLMGSFVTVYNYVGFRLTAPPYRWSSAAVGWIFLVYLVGTFSSSWMGRLADQRGRAPVLTAGLVLMLVGIALSLAAPVPLLVFGVAVFTFGFFGAHATASAWVGRRAQTATGLASSLYLLLYYLGSSAGGTTGGVLWSRLGWPGVTGMVAGLAGIGLLLARDLARRTGQAPGPG